MKTLKELNELVLVDYFPNRNDIILYMPMVTKGVIDLEPATKKRMENEAVAKSTYFRFIQGIDSIIEAEFGIKEASTIPNLCIQMKPGSPMMRTEYMGDGIGILDLSGVAAFTSSEDTSLIYGVKK